MSITIKQAFQKLAMVTGAAVKNPWFIGRNLNQAFADIAENVVDASGDKVTVTQTLSSGTEIGSIKVNNDTTTLYAPAGGSTVSVTPVITTGTKIATITVDDVDSDLYAPAGGGGGGGIDYSTTEQDTGLKWIDGKTIYQRSYNFGTDYNIPNSSTASFSLDGIATFETIIKCYGTSSDGIYQGDIIINNNNGIADGTAVKNSSASVRYLTVQYTKKTT